MGQKDGEKWTAAVDLQPTLSKSDRLLDGAVVSGSLTLPDVPLWWPHTHGKPVTMPCQIDVQVDGQWHTLPAGHVGFRDLRVERGNGLVQFQVNGEPVFCRGACWTTDDLLRLHGDESALRRSLELARDAGLNMLRVGGTMAYESDAFYTLCDELGILVWQDFMFANMDYPVADEGFLANITREAEHQLQRLQTHPCVAAYCGSSEIEQQAAMLGLPASEWSNPFFDQLLPALCARWHAGVPYFRSSPSEGALPFHVATGIAHYYGVGAYKRPLADVKSAGVKFASECLGFSHVPDPETIALMMDGSTPPAHHPLWKARQPRDVGAGWDFEDTRDHYLRELFGVDAVTLRSHDPERYLAVSRVVPGEVMRRVFNEWRSPRNVCHGGIVWFWKDVWPGAGWGVVDSTGRPKASYWHLKRAWSPRSVGFTDEGLDGLHMHVVNEPAEPLEATLEFALYQHGRVQVASASAPITVPARGALTLSADALLGRFADTSCAYRFGPPPYDVAVVRLRAVDGALLSDDFHFPQGHGLPLQHDARLSGSAERMTDGRVRMTLQSETFVQSVSVECDGFVPNDAYFHLAPRTPRELVWHPSGDAARKFKAHVSALNLTDLLTLRVD
jgi:beta-mannosidase